jgi:MFS family permease
MVGVWFGLTGQQSSFLITAGAFAFLLVLLTWGFKQHGKIGHQHAVEKIPFKQTYRILKQDKLLQCLIMSNVLCMFIYAQMDSSLIQYLTRAEVPELVVLISAMIVANSVTIVCFQFVLLKMMANLPLTTRIQFALVLLAISQFWFALNPLEWFWGWIGAAILMSFAEAILFPTMNVHIDRLAPSHLRGAYFGAASFYSLGYAMAPLGGGMILDALGGGWLFSIAGGLCGIVFYFYGILDKLPRPDFINSNKENLTVKSAS